MRCERSLNRNQVAHHRPKCSTISSTASASHSAGTSRPSLNWSGSSTSNRRHLLLIGCLALNGEGDVLVGERLKCRLRNQVLARCGDPTGEATQQEPERALLGLAVRECDGHHTLLQSV